MPPAALTFTRGSTCPRIRRTSSTVAPPLEKPVEVLTKSGSTSLAISQSLSFSPWVSRQFSKITLETAPTSRQAATT